MANEIKNAMVKGQETATSSADTSAQVDEILGSEELNNEVVDVKDIQLLGAAIKLQNMEIGEITRRLLEIETTLAEAMTEEVEEPEEVTATEETTVEVE